MSDTPTVAASLDSKLAPMPACSLETIPLPIHTSSATLTDGGEDTTESHRVWPLMTSCYQLNSETGTRSGYMEFQTIAVQDSVQLQKENEAHVILQPDSTSGILDGKWTSLSQTNQFQFATAHSTGEIRVHTYHPWKDVDNSSTCPIQFATQTPETEDGALCLAVNWNQKLCSTSSSQLNQPQQHQHEIVSTYSNGMARIHNVHTTESGQITLEESHTWAAHTLFGCPAEVWSADFVGEDHDLIVTCADDTKLIFWNVNQQPSTPVLTVETIFSAGTTCAAQHPRQPHAVLCGSYDETLALYDVRYLSAKPLLHIPAVGGGIWRIKWHPLDSECVLVGAMHGGCRVINLSSSSEESSPSETQATWDSYSISKEFQEHQSMAYGADWLVDDNRQVPDTAVSCSFYDKAVHVWR